MDIVKELEGMSGNQILSPSIKRESIHAYVVSASFVVESAGDVIIRLRRITVHKRDEEGLVYGHR